jgi:hypothetical protein
MAILDQAGWQPFAIQLANSPDALATASAILSRAYATAGYGEQHAVMMGAYRAPFVACSAGEIVGTLTLTADSDEVLSFERTFPDIVARLRSGGANLCELTQFAFDIIAPKPLLAALFATIFDYGSRRFDCTDLVIEVNPSHRRFYERQLGFEQIGPERINAKVGAPSVPLALQMTDIVQQIASRANGVYRDMGQRPQ